MLKHIILIACIFTIVGCASNNAGISPVRTGADAPKVEVQKADVSKVETPVVEPKKTVDIVPQKPTVTVEQPKVQIPTTLNFKRNVTFNHKFHSDSFACTKCHTDKPGKITNFGKDFAHETCKGCHKENGQSISCNSCHRG